MANVPEDVRLARLSVYRNKIFVILTSCDTFCVFECLFHTVFVHAHDIHYFLKHLVISMCFVLGKVLFTK